MHARTQVRPETKPLTCCTPQGRNVTGFSNTEETAVGKDTIMPFLLEDKLKVRGQQKKP